MEMNRRSFMTATAIAAMGAGSIVVNVASAQEDTTQTIVEATAAGCELWDQPSEVDCKDPLLDAVLDVAEVTEDLVLPDGSVVPACYVNLRNHINRVGSGVGSDVNETSWELFMQLWSEEDAIHECEMPMLGLFSAVDYAVASGRSVEECEAICEDMSQRGLIWRCRRAGVTYYMLLAYLTGFWENQLKRYTYEMNAAGWAGDDFGPSTAITTLNTLRPYPISAEVVEGGVLPPEMDFEANIARNTKCAVADCQCLAWAKSLGDKLDDPHPDETCLALGEMAEFFIETGMGREITTEEALEVFYAARDRGMVPETIANQNPDILCLCHADHCRNLGGIRAMDGLTVWMETINPYVLKYDADKCIQCGMCIDRCPMSSISFGEDGYCEMDTACVRCGQCVYICPADARILAENPKGMPELPRDYPDYQIYLAKDRYQRGYITDFTGTSL